MAVYLCPAGNPNAQQHYEDTILTPVDFKSDGSEWQGAVAALEAAHPSGVAAMWGSTPGSNGLHRAKHDLMRSGDLALFYAGKRFFAIGTIAVPFVNQTKARELWGSDDNGDTWELMFSFSDITDIDLPVETFNDAVGYASNKFVQGFSRLDDEKSASVLDLLGADAIAPPDPVELQAALTLLDGPLDKEITSAARVEQRYLRLALQGGKAKPRGQCALCGREFPVSMLVAAHIKPRSMCTDDEKKDIPAIAMLACALGCDALFERGYVTVDIGGAILRSTSKPMAAELTAHLDGKSCVSFTEDRAKYFAWHLANRFA